MRDVDAVMRAVAAFELPATTVEPPGPIESDDWPLTLAQLEHEKLTGIAVAAAEDGWLPLKAEQFKDLVDRHRDAMAWTLRLEMLLLDVADAFDEEGIEFLVLKGPPVARVAYPDPSWRVFHDLDLLVRTRDWRRAVTWLERGFGPRRIPEPRPGWDERFGKGAVFVADSDQQLDLHRTLAQGPFAMWIDSERLFDMRARWVLGGRTLHTLDETARFVHACIHAVLGDRRPSLGQLRDIVQTAPFAARDQLERVTHEWHLGAVLALAARRCAPLDDGRTSDVLRGLDIDRRGHRALRAYIGAPYSRRRMEMETIRAISGSADKARYLFHRSFPGRAFRSVRRGRWTRQHEGTATVA